MFTTRSMRATALVAAAFVLAACGSDNAAGPTTANNAQIISEMNDALADSSLYESGTGLYKVIALQVAIAGLESGAPVNPGNITIDGQSYRFNTMSLVVEDHDSVSGGVLFRTAIVVGWRHTNGDSVFIAGFTSEDGVVSDRRVPLSLMQRSTSSRATLADIATRLRGGQYTVSRSVSANGPDQPMLVAVYLGGKFYGALPDDGIESGSISHASATGECDLDGASESEFVTIDAARCELVRSNVSLEADTYDPMSESTPPAAAPVITVPAQSVTGVKFVALTAAEVP
jgi:hypothetical protein